MTDDRELMLALAGIEDRLVEDLISRNEVANRKNPSGNFVGEILVGVAKVRAKALRDLANEEPHK